MNDADKYKKSIRGFIRRVFISLVDHITNVLILMDMIDEKRAMDDCIEW